MLQQSGDGYLLPDWYGAEQHQPCVSRDPHKDERMAAIHKALEECNAEHPIFHEDEVDIHLNPRIGADWQQKRVVTPGQNEKDYRAGDLHSSTGKISYVGENSKSSSLYLEKWLK